MANVAYGFLLIFVASLNLVLPSSTAESTTNGAASTSGAESTTNGAESSTNNAMTTSGAESTTNGAESTSGAESTTNGAESSTNDAMTTSGAESTTNGAASTSGAESTTNGAESSTNGAMATSGAESTTNGAESTSGAESTTNGVESTTNGAASTSPPQESTPQATTEATTVAATTEAITTTTRRRTTPGPNAKPQLPECHNTKPLFWCDGTIKYKGTKYCKDNIFFGRFDCCASCYKHLITHGQGLISSDGYITIHLPSLNLHLNPKICKDEVSSSGIPFTDWCRRFVVGKPFGSKINCFQANIQKRCMASCNLCTGRGK